MPGIALRSHFLWAAGCRIWQAGTTAQVPRDGGRIAAGAMAAGAAGAACSEGAATAEGKEGKSRTGAR